MGRLARQRVQDRKRWLHRNRQRHHRCRYRAGSQQHWPDTVVHRAAAPLHTTPTARRPDGAGPRQLTCLWGPLRMWARAPSHAVLMASMDGVPSRSVIRSSCTETAVLAAATVEAKSLSWFSSLHLLSTQHDNSLWSSCSL